MKLRSRVEVIRLVTERAAGRCEYCRMHQALQGATFHCEHVIPAAAGGTEEPDNLALACPGCNLKKADRLTVTDPLSGDELALYHPRRDVWSEHFEWTGTQLIGQTALGRAMIAALDLNHPRRQRIRDAESLFGLFPPDSP